MTTKTVEKKRYRNHVEKSDKLLGSSKNKIASQGGALRDGLASYSLYSKALDQDEAAKHHLVGLCGFWIGARRAESEFGFLSESAFRLRESVTSALCRFLKPEASRGEMELFGMGWSAALILLIGGFEIGRLHLKKGDKAWREELLARLYFGTEGPRIVFRSLASLLSEEPKKTENAAAALEGILLGAVLLLFSEEEKQNEGLEEGLFPKLQDAIQKTLTGFSLGLEAEQRLQGLLEAILSRVEAKDRTGLREAIKTFIEESGGSFDELYLDLQELLKSVHFILTTFQESKENRPNLIQLIG